MAGNGMESIGTREEGRNTMWRCNEAVIELMRRRSLHEKDIEGRERWKLAMRNLSRVQPSERKESFPNESCKE
jgi:hypothetical protein